MLALEHHVSGTTINPMSVRRLTPNTVKFCGQAYNSFMAYMWDER